MRHTGDVEPEPVIAVDVQRRAVADACPTRQRKQSFSVFPCFRRRGQKMRADGARVSKPHAGDETLRGARSINGSQNKTALLAADEGKWPVIGKSFAGSLQAIEREMRQIDGNHPTHD